MTETKTQNGLHLMEVVNGKLVQQLYQGYTKKEAKRMFKELLKQEKERSS